MPVWPKQDSVVPSKPAKRGPGRPSKPISPAAIVEIARDAFAVTGYEGTSMRMLAENVGVTKASLFHHFPSKEALYLAVMRRIVDDLGAMILQAQLQTGSFSIRLHRLGGMIADYLGANPAVASLLVQAQVLQTPFMKSDGREAAEAVLSLASGFIQAGIEAGKFVEQDARQLVLTIAGAHLYYFATPVMSGGLVGQVIFDEDAVALRKRAVLAQIARLCGVSPPA